MVREDLSTASTTSQMSCFLSATIVLTLISCSLRSLMRNPKQVRASEWWWAFRRAKVDLSPAEVSICKTGQYRSWGKKRKGGTPSSPATADLQSSRAWRHLLLVVLKSLHDSIRSVVFEVEQISFEILHDLMENMRVIVHQADEALDVLGGHLDTKGACNPSVVIKLSWLVDDLHPGSLIGLVGHRSIRGTAIVRSLGDGGCCS